MTAMVSIEVPEEIHTRIADCIAARNEGMAQAEESDRSGWNKALIDQGIDVLAASGRPFSANDLRVLLPEDLPGPLFGARFQHAVNNREVIRFIGTTTSTKRNTHGKAVNVYVGRNT